VKVCVFVEGVSDRLALLALWTDWRDRLRTNGWGIQIYSLENKCNFFSKIGHRAAEKLVGSANDIVIGLPDFYPNTNFEETKYRHPDVKELRSVQERLIKENLESVYHVTDVKGYMERFLGSALKHDLEMLLLAAINQLRGMLRTANKLEDNWRHPIEDQNQMKPPKRVVEELFLQYRGRKYRDTRDAGAVLEQVTNIRDILISKAGLLECPIFKEMLDWVGGKTGIQVYQI
jgi:hypothetical protein